jgi:hypothetical protein
MAANESGVRVQVWWPHRLAAELKRQVDYERRSVSSRARNAVEYQLCTSFSTPRVSPTYGASPSLCFLPRTHTRRGWFAKRSRTRSAARSSFGNALPI